MPLNAFVAPRGSMTRMVAEGDADEENTIITQLKTKRQNGNEKILHRSFDGGHAAILPVCTADTAETGTLGGGRGRQRQRARDVAQAGAGARELHVQPVHA